MTEHQKHTVFLKTLLTYEDSDEHRAMQDRILRAERDLRSVGSACRLVGLAALFALAGLGYCAVLLPDFFHNSRHFLIQLFCALGLGSALCLVVFLGLWLWHRGIVNRLHDECRKLITSLVKSRIQLDSRSAATVVVHQTETAVYQIETQTSAADTEVINLRKVS